MNRLEVHGGDCIRSHGDLYLGFELGEKEMEVGIHGGVCSGASGAQDHRWGYGGCNDGDRPSEGALWFVC